MAVERNLYGVPTLRARVYMQTIMTILACHIVIARCKCDIRGGAIGIGLKGADSCQDKRVVSLNIDD